MADRKEMTVEEYLAVHPEAKEDSHWWMTTEEGKKAFERSLEEFAENDRFCRKMAGKVAIIEDEKRNQDILDKVKSNEEHPGGVILKFPEGRNNK